MTQTEDALGLNQPNKKFEICFSSESDLVLFRKDFSQVISLLVSS
jgi:hypothetical protein